MEVREQQIEHLTLRSVEPRYVPGASHERVLILGNAYGVMPYQLPLAVALAERGLKPYWFAFSGQEGTEGSFATESVLNDVSIAMNHLAAEHTAEPISMIAHCVGALIALEYLHAHQKKQEQVKKMIIYGLLFNPARRWKHALPRLKKSGVNVGFTKEDTNYSPLSALSSLHVPLLFCHAKDNLNLRRASQQEVAKAVETAPEAEIVWFDKGYDHDLDSLPEFVECYYSWLRKPANSMTEEEAHAEMGD